MSYQSFLNLDLFQHNQPLLNDVYGTDLSITEDGTISNRTSNIGNLTISTNTISANIGGITLQPEGSNVIDVTGHKISNLADPIDPGDAVTKSFMQANYLGSGSTGNIGFSANTILSTNTNGNIILSPNGTGVVQLAKNLDMNSKDILNCNSIVVGNGIFGTLSTATQPNITSLGIQAATLDMNENNVVKCNAITANSIHARPDIGNINLDIHPGSGGSVKIFGNLSMMGNGISGCVDLVAENIYSGVDIILQPNPGRVVKIQRNLDLNNNRIINLPSPTDPTDASTKSYTDGKLSLAGGTMSGDIDMNEVASLSNATLVETAVLFVQGSLSSKASGIIENEISAFNFSTPDEDLILRGYGTGAVKLSSNLDVNSKNVTNCSSVTTSSIITNSNGNLTLTPNGTGTVIMGKNVTSAFNISCSAFNASTIVASTSISGTISTASQPNITSLGILSALRVDNISLDNNTITTANVNGNLVLSANGTGSVVFSNNLDMATKNIASATSISCGTLNATTVAGTNVGGTITTASQPNITLLGTLSSLQVDNISVDGNTITTTNVNGNLTITPNGTGVIVLGKALNANSLNINSVATLTAVSLAGTITTAAQTNITSLGPQNVDLNMDSHKITNVSAPTANTDAANKLYVDNVLGTLDYNMREKRVSQLVSDNAFLIVSFPTPISGTSGIAYTASGSDFKFTIDNAGVYLVQWQLTWDYSTGDQTYAGTWATINSDTISDSVRRLGYTELGSNSFHAISSSFVYTIPANGVLRIWFIHDDHRDLVFGATAREYGYCNIIRQR